MSESKLKVGIIDSGVDIEAFETISLEQYTVSEGGIIREEAIDEVGHGTAIVSVLEEQMKEEFNKITILSVRLVKDDDSEYEGSISAKDMAASIDFAVDQGCDIINISMGTEDFYNRELVDRACDNAYRHGISICCAEANNDFPTLPWASENVIKVREGNDKQEIQIVDEKTYSEVVIKGKAYKVKSKEHKKIYLGGNSFACAFVTADMCIKKMQNKDISFYTVGKRGKVQALEQDVELRENKIDIKNAVLVSFSKEMHGIIRFRKYLPYNVVGVLDTERKRTAGLDAGTVMGLEETGIKIYSKMSDIEKSYDTLIIGYLNVIEDIDERFSMDNILQWNLECSKANVYSFVPIKEKWVEKYKKEGIQIETAPVIDKKELERLRKAIPFMYENHKPVIGVFGTNSQLGKFTFQLELKNQLEQMNIKVFHLATEHQGYLLGASSVFPNGYQESENITLESEEVREYLTRVMVYADKATDCDLILMGNQSFLIPPDVRKWSFIDNAAFLEGTQPDLSIVIVNPLIDDPQYIQDTIDTLRALYKAKTIALAFPDNPIHVNRLKLVTKKKLSEQEKEVLKSEIERKYGVMAGCITDENFVRSVATEIVRIGS